MEAAYRKFDSQTAQNVSLAIHGSIIDGRGEAAFQRRTNQPDDRQIEFESGGRCCVAALTQAGVHRGRTRENRDVNLDGWRQDPPVRARVRSQSGKGRPSCPFAPNVFACSLDGAAGYKKALQDTCPACVCYGAAAYLFFL